MPKPIGSARLALGVLAGAILAGAAQAQPAATPAPGFGAPFMDHGVLQRDRPIPVWGAATPGAVVRVDLAGQAGSATADAHGRWSLTLPARAAGGPYDLTLRAGAASVSLHDVLVGDVWLCSGQSNMEFSARHATNADNEIGMAPNDQIRLLKVAKVSIDAPQAGFGPGTAWVAARPGTVDNFSAICLFIGRQLQKTAKVPMGLIDDSWGGSKIEAWISAPALHAVGGVDAGLDLLALDARDHSAALDRWRMSGLDPWFAAHDVAPGGGKPWSASDLDDSAWGQTRADGRWNTLGLPDLQNFGGTVWYRASVTLTQAQAAQAASIDLGPADYVDLTYVNGVEVGGVEGRAAPRHYVLPAHLLHAGVNSVAVQVIGAGGWGGLWGAPAERGFSLADGSKVPLAGPWRYRTGVLLAESGYPPHAPWAEESGLSTLFNGMIAPLAGYGLKGVAWYQGEANVDAAVRYMQLLPAMMADWRGRFGQDDLPFLIIQLSAYHAVATHPAHSDWAALRDAQRRVVEADPHTGLVVTLDVGDRFDIHPTEKEAVAQRTAKLARRLAYGETLVAEGPHPLEARRVGDQVVIRFADVAQGLTVYSDTRPIGFELCDAAEACRYVDAHAQGDAVTLDVGAGPALKVRYAWADAPVVNLFNSEDLPATPFEMAVK